MAERGDDIVAPSASKAPVWKYFGYTMDLTTRRVAVGKRATCKLCRVKVAHSGGRLISKTTYVPTIAPNTEICDDLRSCAEVQSQLKMNVFYKPSCTVEELSSSLVRAQELASAIVDFVVRDLRTVNVVDSVGFSPPDGGG